MFLQAGWMTVQLTKQKSELCRILQDGLEIVPEPFNAIAARLGISEQRVLDWTKELQENGVIRRISAVINYRALGRIATLAAAKVGEGKLESVVSAVNNLAGVSHNYLREHPVNLWFTLQADSEVEIAQTLQRLSQTHDIEVFNLPMKRFFKLHVRFGGSGNSEKEADSATPASEIVELNDYEKKLIRRLQGNNEIVPRPFDKLADTPGECESTIKSIRNLMDKGVIRRIGAVVDHRKMGFTANVMFVCYAPCEKVSRLGQGLADLEQVSHCYERHTQPGWDYNIFAMMHAKDIADINRAVDEFVSRFSVERYELLPTIAELKKRPVRQSL